MDVHEFGAAHLLGAAAPFLCALDTLAAGQPKDNAGVRLHDVPGLAGLLGPQAIGALAPGRRPVRAILFDKSAANNWALRWHQDRTIAVRARAAVEHYGPWSVKSGMFHVEPPFAVIERMLTIRVHLDDVDTDNAPLLIAPSSHRMGRVEEAQIGATVARCGVAACLAARGDAWIYATSILHSSAAAAAPRHRRVLQIDYSADALPDPLEWLGV